MGNNQSDTIISQLTNLKIKDYEHISNFINRNINLHNINEKTSNGTTLLLWCICNLDDEVLYNTIKLLIKSNVNIDLTGNFIIKTHNKKLKYKNQSPLFALTRKTGTNMLFKTIELLINSGAKINFYRDEYLYRYHGIDYIYQFRNQYDYNIFELLVKNGMNINDANIICRVDGKPLTMLTYMGGGDLINNIEVNTKESELWLINKIINLINDHTKLSVL